MKYSFEAYYQAHRVPDGLVSVTNLAAHQKLSNISFIKKRELKAPFFYLLKYFYFCVSLIKE